MPRMKRIAVQAKALQGLTERRVDAVLRTATQEIVRTMQTPKAKGGLMPVDTGFLKNSIVTSVNGGALHGTPGADADGGSADSWELVVAGFNAGDVLTVGYTAHYARYQEYGTSAFAGNFFMLNAVNRWPAAVRRAVAEAKRRIRA